jgi:hypothetical protein
VQWVQKIIGDGSSVVAMFVKSVESRLFLTNLWYNENMEKIQAKALGFALFVFSIIFIVIFTLAGRGKRSGGIIGSPSPTPAPIMQTSTPSATPVRFITPSNLNPTPTPQVTPTPRPTPTPIPTPTPSPTPTPIPTPTPQPTPEGKSLLEINLLDDLKISL